MVLYRLAAVYLRRNSLLECISDVIQLCTGVICVESKSVLKWLNLNVFKMIIGIQGRLRNQSLSSIYD